MKCRQAAAAMIYTSLCSICHLRPNLRIHPFVDVSASGISNMNAVMPAVMDGR
jgi:hypothetical protein